MDTSNSAPHLGPVYTGPSYRALPGAQVLRTVRTPAVCQLVPGARGGETLSSCSPEGEDSKLMRMTQSHIVRFGEHLISVRRRARS